MTVFDVGHQFLAMTDRLALSPAEYQLLSEWDAAGVPASVVQAGVAERVWQELARGLMEARPSRMFELLRACGALARLLPELDALFGVPAEPGRLTTHVLDTRDGRPAAGMLVDFAVRDGDAWRTLRTLRTNADGRTDQPLLAGEAMQPGCYRLVFHAGAYFRERGTALPEPAFLDRVPLEFGIADAGAHYHVPLLCSPWSYSTYRGS